MSFGFSPSDFVTLITIVTKSYKGWRDACGEYTDITASLKQLLTLIQQVHAETNHENSVLVRTSGDRAALESILRSNARTARDLGDIIKDYDALGHGKSREKNWVDLERNWKRFRFGSKDLQGLRSRIQGHVNMISAHLTAAGVSALSRVELDIKALPDQMQLTIDGLAAEIRAGRREGSILTTYDDDEKDVWRQFRRELIGEGMRSSMIHQFKPRIKSYLRALAEEGLLQECEPDADEHAGNVEALDHTTFDQDVGSDQLSSDDDSINEEVRTERSRSIETVGNASPLAGKASPTPHSDHTTLGSTEDEPAPGLPATYITDDEAESDPNLCTRTAWSRANTSGEATTEMIVPPLTDQRIGLNSRERRQPTRDISRHTDTTQEGKKT